MLLLTGQDEKLARLNHESATLKQEREKKDGALGADGPGLMGRSDRR